MPTNLKNKWVIAGAVGAVLLLIVIWFLAAGVSTKNAGIDHETGLSAQYRDNQNYLSAYIAGFYEQTGVAKVKSDKLDQILIDAVKGRYEGKMAPGTGGAFFSAITEAYPDLKGLNIYDKIATYVQGGRAGYRDKQSKLLDQLRAWDSWKSKGLFHPLLVSIWVPDKMLEARFGETVLTGDAAEEKMKQLVLLGQATKAYDTGTDTVLTP